MNKKKSLKPLGSGVPLTTAVLAVYDSGVVSPPAILAALMQHYPMLTMATISNILREHRYARRKPATTPEKPKPKTKVQIIQDSIKEKCKTCGLRKDGRPCVLPENLCPYPEMTKQLGEIQRLIEEGKARHSEIKVPGGKIIYTKPARKKTSVIEEFEQELDEMNKAAALKREAENVPYFAPGRYENSYVENAMFVPESIDDSFEESGMDDELLAEYAEAVGKSKEDIEEDNIVLDDFADILAPWLKNNP